jgi:anti-sigma B factor antagonist
MTPLSTIAVTWTINVLRRPCTVDKDVPTAYIARPPADSPELAILFQREYVVTIGLFSHGSTDSQIRAFMRLWREGVMALSITNSRIDGVIVVHLSGAIFFDEDSTSLRVRVKDLLDKSRQIVLDLGNVTRIDSSGLGTLVALYASARKVGGDIRLANLGNHIKEALRITRLVTLFDIFDKTEDAVASFNRATATG